jgi:hypothetical protein
VTPERIVAALAAVAVGFGVTLVGVALDDDADRGYDELVETQAQGEPTTAERARSSCDEPETVLVVRTDDDVTLLVERLSEYDVNDGGFVFELDGDRVDTTDTARAITAEPVIAEVLQLDAPRRILVCDDETVLSEAESDVLADDTAGESQ